MKKLLLLLAVLTATATAAAEKTTARIDAQTRYQRITGFGGFVCSPGFAYNHMTNEEIKRVWGKGSTVGCNIMRLYIPIGKNAWGQSLATAKLAKQLGLIVFASPWGQPAEWKTNGSSNAKNADGSTGKLKRENWADYAQYLEDYVQYLRKNGVELDAISIQNEPDWAATYAGCLWSASEIAEFVRTYGKGISCKVMAPETLAVSDSYANALNSASVLEGFDIYGGHQYGGIGSTYRNLAKKGKEIWMTEYLINWNEIENNSRNFDFTKDFFDFFRAINTCMVGDFNAWVHYAAKRYYGMMGDGQRGAGSSGSITKRGYVMGHFARYVTGMTRIGATFGGGLEGSAYVSTTGDTVVAVMANNSEGSLELTVDLPFYTQRGEVCTTGRNWSFRKTALSPGETCRPVVEITAQSVATVLFVRSRDRQPSDMKGSATRYDRLDDMTTTKTTFGSTYKLSGGTNRKFDSSNALISTRKTTAYGYIALNDRYTELVMHINRVTSTGSLTAGRPTLYYVNAEGTAKSHEYERIDLGKGEGFDVVFDLSAASLPDGCIGLLSLTCDNTQSHLTIDFGDVYLSKGSSTYYSKLTGAYVADDSAVLEYSSDEGCTSIDMTEVTGLPERLPWTEGSNRVVYVAEGSALTGTNVVKGGICDQLVIVEGAGTFRPAQPFTATKAQYTCNVDGQHIVQLPFAADISEGVRVYKLTESLEPVAVTTIRANEPVLVEAQGRVTFVGRGETSYAPVLLTDDILPIATPTAIATPRREKTPKDGAVYNLKGMRTGSGGTTGGENARHSGLIISNGRKYVK